MTKRLIKKNTTYQRIKAILCKEWSLPPFDFDKRQRAGEILLQDAITTLELIMATEPIKADGIVRYIYQERVDALEQQQKDNYKRKKELENYLVLLARTKSDGTPRGEAALETNRSAAIAELDRLRKI